jgi:ABC-type uncharacterized transport system substrate-binding protein
MKLAFEVHWTLGTVAAHGGRGVLLWLAAAAIVLASCTTAVSPGANARKVGSSPGMALLISDNVPAFADVEREIVRRFSGGIEAFRLAQADDLDALQKRVQDSDKSVVVTIGLPAAQLARRLTGKRVIFCQVFGFEEHQLETPWMKGVAAVPPLSEQLRYWKALAPDLRRIGVITGPHLTGLVDEARAEARRAGVELLHSEVHSDKEMLYTYRRMARRVQGLWLAPDNRVLSREVIRELLAYSVKEGKQVLVFNPQLLALGGLLSAETDPKDIAQRVLERVNALDGGSTVPGPDVVALTRARVHVNAEMVKRFGLSLPRELAGTVYAP